jgi:hypothetical protein
MEHNGLRTCTLDRASFLRAARGSLYQRQLFGILPASVYGICHSDTSCHTIYIADDQLHMQDVR